MAREYAPCWFDVKVKWQLHFGAVHFFQIIRRSKYLKENYKHIIENTLCNIFYSGHSESVLMAKTKLCWIVYGGMTEESEDDDTISNIRTFTCNTSFYFS